MPQMDAGSSPAKPSRSKSSSSSGGSSSGPSLASLLTPLQPAAPAPAAPGRVPLPALVPPTAPAPVVPNYQSYLSPTSPQSTLQRQGYVLSSGESAEQFMANSKAEQEPSYEEQRATYERNLHARAIGSDVQGPHLEGKGVGVGDVQRMTWDQYNALDPQQKAAVDFNTMLVRATRKDLHNQDEYHPTDQQRATYDASIERMFGEKAAASETYAPETMALLRQINYRDDSAKLDDFLNLNAAITKKDLRGLPYDTGPQAVGSLVSDLGSTDPAQVRTNETRDLAAKTNTLETSLAKGNQLLSSMTSSAAMARNDLLANPLIGMGGIENQAKLPLGYQPAQRGADGSPSDLNTYFQDAYAALSDKKSGLTLDEVRTAMGQLPDHGAFDAFMQYANQRSSGAERFGVPLGDADGAKYRTPEQFRELLGLDE